MQVKLKIAIMRAATSQYELAATVGISETRLSRICRGRAVPTDDEQRRIAAALGQSIEDLFGNAENPEKRPPCGG